MPPIQFIDFKKHQIHIGVKFCQIYTCANTVPHTSLLQVSVLYTGYVVSGKVSLSDFRT